MSKLVLICAPSGTGKTTVTRLLKATDYRFKHVMVLCTRDIREKEIGREEKEQVTVEHLNFLDNKEMLVNKNEKDDVWYGILRSTIAENLKRGFIPILEWDLNRLEHFDSYFKTFKIVLEPESIDEIKSRVEKDNRDPDGKRLNGMIEEVSRIKEGYYDSLVDFRVLNKRNALNDTVLNIRNKIFKYL